MKIFIGADHAGFEMKEKLVLFLRDLGHEVEDKGAFKLTPGDDYPDFIIPVARAVAGDPEVLRGIVIGGSGQGEAMAANRLKGVRAIVFNGQYEPKDGREIPHEIETARQHNNANILSLGARFLNETEAKEAVKLWLDTPFSNDERHVRRLQKIDTISDKSDLSEHHND